MSRFIVFILFLSPYAVILNAQEIVFNTFDFGLNGNSDTMRIGKLQLEDCSFPIVDFSISSSGFIYYSDITLTTDSIYYHYLPQSSPGVADNGIWEIEFEPFFTWTLEGVTNTPKQGMTCDKNGRIFLGGESICVWDNGSITEIGDLPSSMHVRGDLTFRKDKLYLSSVQNTLVEVDLQNPMNSSVVMTFPPGTPEIHGLATIQTGCDSVETYAAASDFFNGTIIYRINFSDWSLEEVCHLPYFVTGLASYDECVLPHCDLSIDLDVDNSSTAIDNDFQSGIACSFPVSITDDDVMLFSELPSVDSINITLVNPESNNEYLVANSVVNLNVIGSNSNSLTLLNTGSSTNLDFELAVQNIQLFNDDLIPVNGIREIKLLIPVILTHPFRSIDPQVDNLQFQRA